MQIQVCVNGHEWLARKLIANRVSFTKHDNVFVRVESWGRAQKFADRFAVLKMYDKAGSVLRVEMVINSPEEFKVRKRGGPSRRFPGSFPCSGSTTSRFRANRSTIRAWRGG